MTKRVLIVLASVLLLLAGTIYARRRVERTVSARIARAATESGVALHWRAMSMGLSAVVLEDVEIVPSRAVYDADLRLHAKSVVVTLRALTPVRVTITSPRLEASGDRAGAAILALLTGISDPSGGRLPIDAEGGSLAWSHGPGGATVTFGHASLDIDPSRSPAHLAHLRGGVVTFPGGSIEPLRVDVTGGQGRAHAIELAADVEPSDAAKLHVDVTDERADAKLEFARFPLSIVHLDRRDVDLSHATLNGSASVTRADDGGIGSRGDLELAGATVHAQIDVKSPMKLSWNMVPIADDPGGMRVEVGTASASVADDSVVAHLSGTVHVGAEARGPFTADLGADVDPIPCARVAKTGGLSLPLLRVTGDLHLRVHLRVSGERRALEPEILQGCDVGLAFGGGP